MTDTQLFRLLDPEGKEIMSGPMNILMELLPDTTARDEALDNMYRVASATVEAEERANEARASMAQILSDGITRLSTRLDSYVEQRKADAEEAEREEREQIQAKLDQLPDPDDPSDEPYSLDRRERTASDQEPNATPPQVALPVSNEE
jgi:hypothetical protein